MLVHCDYCQSKVLAYVAGIIDNSHTLVIVGSGDIWTSVQSAELYLAHYADIEQAAHEFHNVALLALADILHPTAIQ